MKFIIQEYGNLWLLKVYLNEGEANAVAKDGDVIKEGHPTLVVALDRIQVLATQHGVAEHLIGEAE